MPRRGNREKVHPGAFPAVSPALGKSRKRRGISHIPTGNRGWINYSNTTTKPRPKSPNPVNSRGVSLSCGERNIINQVFARRQMVSLSETHVFGPSVVNIVRLGFNRSQGQVSHPSKAVNPAAADTSLGTVTGQTSAFLMVNRITSAGGLGSFAGFTHTLNSIQADDDIVLVRGNHNLKFGVAFERLQANEK